MSLRLKEGCWLRVFQNRILARIFGPKRDANGEGRSLHNEELHSLYRSPNIGRVIKSRRLGWTGNVAGIEKKVGVFSQFSLHALHSSLLPVPFTIGSYSKQSRGTILTVCSHIFILFCLISRGPPSLVRTIGWLLD